MTLGSSLRSPEIATEDFVQANSQWNTWAPVYVDVVISHWAVIH